MDPCMIVGRGWSSLPRAVRLSPFVVPGGVEMLFRLRHLLPTLSYSLWVWRSVVTNTIYDPFLPEVEFDTFFLTWAEFIDDLDHENLGFVFETYAMAGFLASDEAPDSLRLSVERLGEQLWEDSPVVLAELERLTEHVSAKRPWGMSHILKNTGEASNEWSFRRGGRFIGRNPLV